MDRSAAPPTWLEELLELLQSRRRLAIAVAVAVAVLGMLVAAVAPGVLPPTAGVGAAVGLAACLLAVAAVVGLDAGDLAVQGARHVRAAGAEVAVVLRGAATGHGTAAVVQRLTDAGVRRVALVPADAGAREATVEVADGLAQAWARAEHRVLLVDVSRPDGSHAGIVDVVRGQVPLGQAVTFDPHLMLARLGPGSDLETALVELPGLAPRLPADIERAVIALPPLADPASRAGASAVDDVLVLAVEGSTSRVDLLATLEALDAVGVEAEVLLHRPSAAAPAPPAPALPDTDAASGSPEADSPESGSPVPGHVSATSDTHPHVDSAPDDALDDAPPGVAWDEDATSGSPDTFPHASPDTLEHALADTGPIGAVPARDASDGFAASDGSGAASLATAEPSWDAAGSEEPGWEAPGDVEAPWDAAGSEEPGWEAPGDAEAPWDAAGDDEPAWEAPGDDEPAWDGPATGWDDPAVAEPAWEASAAPPWDAHETPGAPGVEEAEPVMAARDSTESTDDPDDAPAPARPSADADADDGGDERAYDGAGDEGAYGGVYEGDQTMLLGLAAIERELEEEAARTASHASSPASDAEVGERRALRAVPAHQDAATSRDLTVGGDDRERVGEDLTTTAVLETLAREIWSRDDLDGTA